LVDLAVQLGVFQQAVPGGLGVLAGGVSDLARRSGWPGERCIVGWAATRCRL
jgi:hypothetical protein